MELDSTTQGLGLARLRSRKWPEAWEEAEWPRLGLAGRAGSSGRRPAEPGIVSCIVDARRQLGGTRHESCSPKWSGKQARLASIQAVIRIRGARRYGHVMEDDSNCADKWQAVCR